MTNNNTDFTSKINMQGVHVELTAAMQNMIREKFSVLLRHNEWIVRINVRLHQDQHHGNTYHYTATGEVVVRGPDLIATVKGEDPYSMMDQLVEKLDQQLRDRHERMKEKRNHPQQIELDATLPKVGDR